MGGTALQYIDFYGTDFDTDVFLDQKFKCFSGSGELLVSELVSHCFGSCDVVSVFVTDSLGYGNNYIV